MKPLVYTWPGYAAVGAALVAGLNAEAGEIAVRHFPDGETYVRLLTPPAGRSVILACGLDRPDEKLSSLQFAAVTARELGAIRIGLVAPYLAYMRQDARFHEGEAVAARAFAGWLSWIVDWLVTVDPHLHRYAKLGEIYPIATAIASSTTAISRWITANVTDPLVIGPDAESRQWAAAVANGANCPCLVLEKVRRGDRDVEITIPNLAGAAGRTPVLVDDIISTARTMAAAVKHLRAAGTPAPVCIGVHALFGGDALPCLVQAGVREVITCNTVAHATNAIDVLPQLADSARDLLNAWVERA